MPRAVRGKRSRPRLGQHFLADLGVVERMVAIIAPVAGERMVEIGPGTGVLTRPLLKRLGKLHAVELDRTLIQRLLAEFKLESGLKIHGTDALQFDYRELARSEGGKLRIVGNLPYSISTQLLLRLIACADCVIDMVFMLQKEVAERIVARPGTRAYGRLSILVQYRCAGELLFYIGPDAFAPPPRVDSAVIRMSPKPASLSESEERIFRQLVARAFAGRRKTLRNAFRGLVSENHFEKASIKPESRPEELNLNQFTKLARILSTNNPCGETEFDKGADGLQNKIGEAL
ncbi:MAG: 16S rRNA (adenine(1518)-N(6)/adenine(1519)-N(6))-dimethyltransferase RsmA [Gammaproteobacteria bacterium]